ncbi:unnamed protein product [Lasius platythorax]|uniref:Secreted protein n=1 Tax=Lasius platythorax TaxID=488582 RepID=A0AAV2NLR8_9HYME
MVMVVVVATLPLAAADHCHPIVEFNRQELRPGASRRKGGNLRSTEEPLILCNPHELDHCICIAVRSGTPEKSFSCSISPFTSLATPQLWVCFQRFGSLDTTVSSQLHILFVTKIGGLLSF